MSEPAKRLLRFSLSLLPDHLAGGQVVGHVFDEKDLEKRFVVEMLIDGFPAALARAERFDADLARDGFGDGCYRFGFFVDAAAPMSLRSASPMAGKRWARPCCFKASCLRANCLWRNRAPRAGWAACASTVGSVRRRQDAVCGR